MVHFIGKDNIVFHCIIFPSMLKAHGDYILPENVPANEFLNLEGNKLSTSKNWAVWLHEYLVEFPDMQDVLRYALTANAPETKDNDFTWKDFQAKNNNELVAIFGNFINRVVVLTHKYYDGIVPKKGPNHGELSLINTYPDQIAEALDSYKFREASQRLMNLARLGNQFLQREEPWKKIKNDPAEVEGIMFTAIQIAAALAHLCEPFLPFTSKKLKSILNIEEKKWSEISVDFLESESYLIEEGHKINEQSLLFRPIEDNEIEAQLAKLEATKKKNNTMEKDTTIAPQKETITYDDFVKLDMRVGTILEAEKMPKTDKLMVMKVDTGIDTRTIVSGIAQHFEAATLIGKQVTVLVNLAPRKLRGVESQGMILLAENSEGKLVFVNPDDAGINNGDGIS